MWLDLLTLKLLVIFSHEITLELISITIRIIRTEQNNRRPTGDIKQGKNELQHNNMFYLLILLILLNTSFLLIFILC